MSLMLELLFHPLSFSLLLFFLILLVFRYNRPPTSKYNLPPSPWKLPIIGNMHQLGPSLHRTLKSLGQRHGPLMLLYLGSSPSVVVSSADVAREVLKTHDLIFSSRPKSSIAKRLLYDYKDVALAPYSEYWRQMRRICILQLLSAKQVQSFQSVREEETALMIKKIEEQSGSSSLNLSEMFVSLTNNIICRISFGRKYSGLESGRNVKEMIGELLSLLGVIDLGDFIPSLAWLKYINGIVEERSVLEDGVPRRGSNTHAEGAIHTPIDGVVDDGG
ncbi:hypothetical protein HHK36_029541 [Tetracentron sinense]|uniref:Cytochrome P450 n=1 Tax=Tetracentron sinense TaxID=13715 RepID=A0A834YEZ4_TETSI|nr:hypothetical protein HHK36_029541 [Tetracentron sinense]